MIKDPLEKRGQRLIAAAAHSVNDLSPFFERHGGPGADVLQTEPKLFRQACQPVLASLWSRGAKFGNALGIQCLGERDFEEYLSVGLAPPAKNAPDESVVLDP